MDFRWRKLFGLGVQSMCLVVALVAVTSIFLPEMIQDGARKIVIDHEVIDLAEETRQRAWEFLDLVGVLRDDVIYLAENLHELPDLQDKSAFEQCIGEYGERYERIAVWRVRADEALEPTDLIAGTAELDDSLSEGAREFLSNEFLQQEHGVRVSGIKKIKVTTRQMMRTWGLKTRQHFVFAGVPLNLPDTSTEDSYVLVVAMSPDAAFFRIVSSPRHIGIVLDQRGEVVLHPFPGTALARGGRYVDGVFEQGDPTGQPDLTPTSLIEESLSDGTQHTERVRSGKTIENRKLDGRLQFRFCESDSLEDWLPNYAQNRSIAEAELRSLTAEYVVKEWARETTHESLDGARVSVMRASGLDPNIPRIRLLSTANDLKDLKREVYQRLSKKWPSVKPIPWRDAESLEHCDVSVVRAKFDATMDSNGEMLDDKEITLVRAAFREEIHADLEWELRSVKKIKWAWSLSMALIALIASLVITRPLKRIAAAATSMADSEYDSRLSKDDWAHEVTKMTARLPLKRWDEIGDLARALNSMLAAVHGSYRELQEMNRDLDARVQSRTAELELAKTELEDTNSKLRESNNDLLRMNEIQRRFVHSITHELKTPLTSILGYCELLNRGDLKEDQRAKVGIVRTAGQRLLQLVNEILDSQKVVAGKLQVKIEEFDGSSLLKDLYESMIPIAEKTRNEMDLVCDTLPPISSDRGMISSILENLLSNACKFTRDGTIAIRAWSERRDEQDWILIDIADSGRGIPEDKQRLVFSSFPQILSKGENPTGTGLGLFNCKGYAEAITGTLSFESSADTGTTFFLAFPAHLEEEREDAAARQMKESDSTVGRVQNIESNVVLVIDDDPQICKLLADYLANQKFEVHTTSDGRSGVDMAKKLKPGFITLDAMMPGIDGWSVLKNLKSDPVIGHIPVIMISVLDDPNHKYKGMALGASDYITKPIDWDRLARTLRSYRFDKVDGTVLVVDDDPDVRNLANENLTTRGWRVVTAENGRVALDRISENVPDLILLDLLMPEVDGFEFIHELRTRRQMDVPVLVVTGKELSDEEREKLNGRVESVIRKGSVVWDVLQAEIDRIVKRENEGKKGKGVED